MLWAVPGIVYVLGQFGTQRAAPATGPHAEFGQLPALDFATEHGGTE